MWIIPGLAASAERGDARIASACGHRPGTAPPARLPACLRPAAPGGYAAAVRRPLPTWPIAAGALLLGFAVADVTGVRALGGVVLFLGGLACGLRWRVLLGLP